MKYGGGMSELPYPSDLTAAQWALIEPLLPAPKPKGRKRRVDLRKITNAIFCALKGGISWRMLPREFAPWKTVYHYFPRGAQRTKPNLKFREITVQFMSDFYEAAHKS